MKFKTPTEEEEWQGTKIAPALRRVLESLDGYSQRVRLPEIVVTSLLSGDHIEKSQHFRGEAADIRAHHYTAEQLAKVIYFLLGDHFRRQLSIVGRQLWSAYAHGEGDNFHIHISVDP